MNRRTHKNKTNNNSSDQKGDWLSVPTAAKKLDVTPAALRARLRRKMEFVDGKSVADLGVATGEKFGRRSWRVRIK